MSCTTIEYAKTVIRTTDTKIRLVPLADGNRIPPRFTITTTAIAAQFATTLAIAAAPVALWCGADLVFNAGTANEVTATVAADVAIGALTVKVVPISAAIASGSTATALGSVYLSGVTDASPNSSPKVEDSSNYLSGTAAESATVAGNFMMSVSFDRIERCPGQKLLLDILYNPARQQKEIYVIYARPNGETYEGAAIPTTGTQSGAVQSKATMQVELQMLGCSTQFAHAKDAPNVAWPNPFNPLTDAALRMWMDGTDTKSMTFNSGGLQTWTDKVSGVVFERNVAAATGAVTYDAAGFVQTAPSAVSLLANSLLEFSGNPNITFLGVIDTSLLTTNAFLFRLGGTTSNQNITFQYNISTERAIRFGAAGNYVYPAAPTKKQLFSMADTSGQPPIISVRTNGTPLTLSSSLVPSSPLALSLTGGSSAIATGRYRIWDLRLIESTDPAKIEIHEGDLAWRHDLVSELPDTHPYKQFAPQSF